MSAPTPATPPDPRLSHLRAAATTGAGAAESRMVDVSAKPHSARYALARARLRFPGQTLESVLAGSGPKGPVQELARAAGLLAAKRTAELIPMCHPVALDGLEIVFERCAPDLLEVRCSAWCEARTGVEMEALLGATLAALTVYDMTKGLHHGIRIESVELLEKRGGKSGLWKSPGA